MTTHSFTLDELSSQQVQWLNEKSQKKDQKRDIASRALSNIINFDPKVSNDTQNLHSTSVKELFEKNINKANTAFYLKTSSDETIDLVAELKTKLKKDKLTHDDMHAHLTSDKYKLSDDQATYILASSNNNSISGGVTGFKDLIVNNNMSNGEHQTRNLSLIEISKDGVVNFIGARKIMFDCDTSKIDKNIREDFLGDFESNNCITATVNVNLGNSNDLNSKFTTRIDVDGTGIMGEKIVKNLQLIESKLIPEHSNIIIGDYKRITEEVQKNSSTKEEYKDNIQGLITTILDSPAKFEKDNNIITQLMQTSYAQEVLAEKIVNKINEQVKLAEKDGKISAEDIKAISKDTTQVLSKFIDQPKEFLDRLSKDIVNEVAKQENIGREKKGLIALISSKIKNAINGYEKLKHLDKNLSVYEQAKKTLPENIGKQFAASATGKNRKSPAKNNSGFRHSI